MSESDNWQPELPPENQVTLEGEQEGTGGLRTSGTGTVFMLNISPKFQDGLLLPYSRIERVTISANASEMSLFGIGCFVLIKGKELNEVITAIQTANAWSISEGRSTRNNAQIDSIHITYQSDSEDNWQV